VCVVVFKQFRFKKVDFIYSAPYFYSGSFFKCVVKNVKHSTVFSWILFVVVNIIKIP